MERKYTVSEIDSMRRAIGEMYPDWVSYHPAERAADIENRLRTYMQNGTAPDELASARDAYVARRQAARLQQQAFLREILNP